MQLQGSQLGSVTYNLIPAFPTRPDDPLMLIVVCKEEDLLVMLTGPSLPWETSRQGLPTGAFQHRGMAFVVSLFSPMLGRNSCFPKTKSFSCL